MKLSLKLMLFIFAPFVLEAVLGLYLGKGDLLFLCGIVIGIWIAGVLAAMSSSLLWGGLSGGCSVMGMLMGMSNFYLHWGVYERATISGYAIMGIICGGVIGVCAEKAVTNTAAEPAFVFRQLLTPLKSRIVLGLIAVMPVIIMAVVFVAMFVMNTMSGGGER